MGLTAGTRLGPYEILSPLGGGGMGDVYRARDTRLQRDVAIKVLADHVAHRPELRERFEREARTIAALNHPHICVVHDVGRQDPSTGSGEPIHYLVMEYLEGETLAQRLKQGPLPLADVVRLGAEIGDALDKAHRKGVTHRDLKPANILLTKSGAKLLDFGLAKLRPAAPNPEEQPTQGDPLTAEGTILGTMHYMSPEQLEGKEADARSDIFSFGAVLYEMATGKRAFDGKSQASLIASIMASEPPAMATIQPMAPAAFDRLVRKCLRKDPDERWQSAHDITDELRWIAESTTVASSAAIPAAVGAARRTPRARMALVGAAAIALVIGGFIAWPRLMVGSAPVSTAAAVRFTLGPPDKARFPAPNTNFALMALSPDGTRLVFMASDETGTSRLWVRALDATAPIVLAGTEGAVTPAWSPDGRFIAFVADGKLKKVPSSGGPVQTVAEPAGVGAAWGSKGVIIFARGPGSLFQVSDAGGTVTEATALDTERAENAHFAANFLPDGEHFLFFARSGTPGRSGVYLGALGSKDRTLVLSENSGAAYAAPGYVIFHRDGTVMAQPFDLNQLATTGNAVPIAEDVQFNPASRVASFVASHTGVLAYRAASESPPRSLVWVDRKGTEQPLPVPARGYEQARLSADGTKIAVQIAASDNQIWVYDISRDTLTRLTFQGTQNELPIWSPDGRRIVYYSNQAGPLNLFGQPADGSGAPERLTTNPNSHAAMSWSTDGRRLMFTQAVGGGDRDIWVMDVAERKAAPFLSTPFVEGGAQLSPDGRWMAYVSNESGRAEIYVQPYPGPGGKWQISADGGSEPTWNRKGGELFYRNRARMMAVEVSTAGGFAAGRPRLLFEREYLSIQLPQTAPAYDVSPDGQRFLLIKESAPGAGAPISVILNWPSLLGSRTPGRTN